MSGAMRLAKLRSLDGHRHAGYRRRIGEYELPGLSVEIYGLCQRRREGDSARRCS